MTIVKYLGEIGFKVDWQAWLALSGASGAFFDTTQPNNGLNRNSSRYSGKQGFDLHIVVEADVSVGQTGPVTRYRKISPVCRALDDNESAVDPRQWTTTVTVRSDADADQSGIIPTAGSVIMQALHVITSGTLPSDVWAVHRLQDSTGGDNIYELSSIRENLAHPPNPLYPVAGETLLKVEVVDATTIKTTCRIDGTLLSKNKQYYLTARIGTMQQDFSAPEIELTNITPDTGTGITAFDFGSDNGYGVENNLDQLVILVYRTDTSELLETITGNYGDEFGVMESSVDSGSVGEYITGDMSDGETLAFDKYSWAVATGRTDADAVQLRFDVTLTNNQTGLTSAVASGIFTVENKAGTDY